MYYLKILPTTEQQISLINSFLYDKFIPNVFFEKCVVQKLFMDTAVEAVLHANSSYKESEGGNCSAEYNAEQMILSAFLASEVL